MTDDSSSSNFKINRRHLLYTSAVGLGAGLGLSLSPSTASAKTPVKGGKLRVATDSGSTSDTLDPILIPSSAIAFVTYQVGNWLIERMPNGELKGDLAESWESQDNGKQWTIKLKKGVKFHHGKEFTAEDMVYSLNRNRGPNTKSPAGPLLKTISDIKSDGPYTLVITLSEPNVTLPSTLTQINLIAQPKDGDPAAGIGTGPYILEKAEPGKRYTFRRNPDYFKPNSPWFDELEVLIINDDTARTSALLSGGVDWIMRVPPNLVSKLKKASSLNVVSGPSSRFSYFTMLVDTPPFDNPDLRLALKHAVDREAIIKRVAAGYAEVGNDSSLGSAYPSFDANAPKHTYDPEKAKAYYKKSGHSGPIELKAAEIFPGAVDMAVLFQQSAAKAGITIDLKQVPVDGYWDNVWLKEPFIVSFWGSLTSEDQALSLPYASDAPWNDSHWRRPEFDKLLASARSELDDGKRKEFYRQAAAMVHDDGGHVVVMFSNSIEALSSKVKGYEAYNFGEVPRNTQTCWFEA